MYPCLQSQPEYYKANNESEMKKGYYLDYAIYSPDVPVFKSDNFELLDTPFNMSVVTSPAPFKTLLFDNSPVNSWEDVKDEIEKVFTRRIEQVLRIMADNNHKVIVLGAWGCGAFGNDPYMVADIFKEVLQSCKFFKHVTFAIYSGGENYNVFKEVFEV